MNYEEYLKNELERDKEFFKEYMALLTEDEYIIFPQAIGSITFYNKTDLFEWVVTQQQLNKKYIELNLNS